ncbi:MAG TPA: hypothetical protein VNW25_04260 [Candidatus Sulfotelmatobacter sp.]|nr:hypothetical protein [Candidatus Sulfotelmatobacter sp.]
MKPKPKKWYPTDSHSVHFDTTGGQGPTELTPAPSTGMMGSKKTPVEKSITNDATASRVLNS